jgi:hypothetical protein
LGSGGVSEGDRSEPEQEEVVREACLVMGKGSRKNFFDGAFVEVMVRDCHVFDLEQDGEAGGRRVMVCGVKRSVTVVFAISVVIKGEDGFVSLQVEVGVIGGGCGGRVRSRSDSFFSNLSSGITVIFQHHAACCQRYCFVLPLAWTG